MGWPNAMSDDDAAVFRELLKEIRDLNRTESALEPRVASLEKLMRGNGEPGIAATLERIDERMKGIEDNTRTGTKLEERIREVEQDVVEQRVRNSGIAAIVALIVTVLLRLTGIG